MPAQAFLWQQAVLFLHVPPRELGKERSAEGDRDAVSNAAEAQTMRGLEPLQGTLTLLGITAYISNKAQFPHSQ